MTTFDLPSCNTVSASSAGHFSFSSPDAIHDVYTARLFAIREVRDYTNHLIGGVLSVIDAMGLPDKQAKAIRDLVFREVWDARYAKALEWAAHEVALEQREGIPGIGWNQVDNHRKMHPLSPPEFNPFPFSTTTLPHTSTT